MLDTETAAYQQVLNTTNSTFNLTALSTADLDSDYDIEDNILPRRPGPISSPMKPSAPAGGGTDSTRIGSQEVPKQPVTSSQSVNTLSKSTKNTDNGHKRFDSFECHVSYLFV